MMFGGSRAGERLERQLSVLLDRLGQGPQHRQRPAGVEVVEVFRSSCAD